MGFVNRHRPAVQTVAGQLTTRLVGIGSRHFDKCETAAHDVYRKNAADDLEEVLDGSRLRAFRPVAN